MTSITLSGLQRALHFDMRNTFRFLIRVFSPPDMEFPTVEQIIEDLAAAPVDDILFQPETLTKTGIKIEAAVRKEPLQLESSALTLVSREAEDAFQKARNFVTIKRHLEENTKRLGHVDEQLRAAKGRLKEAMEEADESFAAQ
eukprot:m.90934 g.90934  ORF g.90934 m.90934 type:complete len:143 (+) comp36673_c0_seq3:3417-3845(+)